MIDWDCNGTINSEPVITDINTYQWYETLNTYDDWSNVVYTGGAIGSLGAALDLPLTTDLRLNPEPTSHDYQRMLDGYYVPDTQRCLVEVSSASELSDAINAANAGTGCLNIRLNADIPLGQLSPAYPGTYGDNAFPIITQNIQIDGNGYSITRVNATSDFRFFTINNRGGNPVTVSFTNITFSGGRAAEAGAVLVDASSGGNITLNLDTVNFSGNESVGGNGGALAALSFGGGSSSINITNSSFDNNVGRFGGGFYNGGFDGGNGVVTITNTSFTNNRATQDGGAIYTNAGSNGVASMNLTDSSFINNQAAAGGGAIYSNGTNGGSNTTNFATTSFANNQAPVGDTVLMDATGGRASFIGDVAAGGASNMRVCFNDNGSTITSNTCEG